MAKNVMIPLTLLYRIVELLGYWDVSNYDPVIQLEHFDIIRSLNLKLRRLDLREDYLRIIRANNKDDKDEARIEYLKNRACLRYDEREDSP
jgi:hypothetical protein